MKQCAFAAAARAGYGGKCSLFDLKVDPVEGMTRMRQAAEQAGRDPTTLSMSVFRASPNKQTLEAYAAAGVGRSVLGLPSADRDTVLKQLDEYAPLLG